jgi:hypothetical protein
VASAEAPTQGWRGFALPTKLIAFLLAADSLFMWGSHIFPASPDSAPWGRSVRTWPSWCSACS